jgi:acetyl-CoA carboxylase biotin carboxyl carrier protein
MSKPRTRSKKDRSRGVSQLPQGRETHNGLPSRDRQHILDLVDLLKQQGLTELEVEREGLRIRLRRDSGPGPASTVVWETSSLGREIADVPTVAAAGEASGLLTVTSPIVGTFYRSPSPDADPYVEEGDRVKKGQVLCVVEAMKLMNEIEAEMDGRVVKILAESTKPVEYGQPLFLIDPSPAS